MALAELRRKPAPLSSDALLAWYDRHRRRLPWRALPGESNDPYRVWLSEIMLQQTTVVAAAPYFLRFLDHFPDIVTLAESPLDDVLRLWAGLGYYARARNLHACAKAVAERGGVFPDTEAGLLELPGIGPYTAAAIAAIAFNRKATVVDGNVERVVTRLFALNEELPRAKPTIRALAEPLTPDDRPGDFAQAMMDLGATICTPKKPACALCPWDKACEAHALGIEESFPRKAAKTRKPQRHGAAFVAIRKDGAILLRRRGEKGLLASMTEVPGSDWGPRLSKEDALKAAPLPGDWLRLSGTVNHVFSHFALELQVFKARFPQSTKAPEGCWWSHEVDSEALPSVMRKVVESARAL